MCPKLPRIFSNRKYIPIETWISGFFIRSHRCFASPDRSQGISLYSMNRKLGISFFFFFFYAPISRVPPPRIWNSGKRGDASLFDLREIRRNMEYMGGGGSIQNRRGSKEIDGDDRRPLLFFEWNWNIFYIRTIDLSSMERHYFQFIKNWNSTVIKVIVFNKRIRKLNEYNFSLFKFLQNKRNEKKKRYSSNIS